MSRMTALRLLGEAAVLVITRAVLNHLTRFRDRGPDQVIDFLRPVDYQQAQKLFSAEEESVVGFWKVKAEHDSAESLKESWSQISAVLEQLPSLGDEEIEELQKLDYHQLRARLALDRERIVGFWKMNIGFRLEQRGRLDLAREYLGRMYHNALVLEQWAASQWFYQKRYGTPDEVNAQELAVMKALRDKAKRFRMFALAALIKTWLRCLIPFHETRFLPIPNVSALRRIFSHDLLAAYQEVKECAIALGRLSEEEFAHELTLKV